MQSLSVDTNPNNQKNSNYQCVFNSWGCKVLLSNKEELKQHYRESVHKHLLLFQDKLIHLETTNYEIRKDYHKILKIISNVQQFKKFPEICPKFTKEKDKEENEMGKNKSKKREREKDKEKKEIMNNLANQNIQNMLLSKLIKQTQVQKTEDLIGNKRKRSEDEKIYKNENQEKNEEITLSSIDDDNNENNFVHDDEGKHKIFINKSDDENDNKINNETENDNYNDDDNDNDYDNKENIDKRKKKKNKTKGESPFITPAKIKVIKQNEEEMTDEQIKRFLSETEKKSKYNYDLLQKDFIQIYEKNTDSMIYPKLTNNPEDNNLFVSNKNDNNGKNNKSKQIKNSSYKDKEVGTYEILSESENDEKNNEKKIDNYNDNVFIYEGNNDYYNSMIKEDNNKENKVQNQNDNNKNLDYSRIITKIDYSEKVLNDKKVQWEVKLKKISGWFAIGVSENYDCSEEQNNVTGNNTNFYLSNENITNFKDNKRVNINYHLKEGDNLICLYSPKFRQLKIRKGDEEFLLENVKTKSGRPLVPSAFFENACDQVIFHNFKILAEYKK